DRQVPLYDPFLQLLPFMVRYDPGEQIEGKNPFHAFQIVRVYSKRHSLIKKRMPCKIIELFKVLVRKPVELVKNLLVILFYAAAMVKDFVMQVFFYFIGSKGGR